MRRKKTKTKNHSEIKSGQRFGRWTILENFPRIIKDYQYYFCQCDCGIIKLTNYRNLENGVSKSCGCERNKETAKRMIKHDCYKHSEFSSWKTMMARCYDKNVQGYEDYGGSGIKVCKSWHNPRNFLRDMGKKPTARHTIDRIKNHLGYSKNNCRWSTPKEQATNRRDTILIEIGDVSKSLTDWCKILNLNYSTIHSRIVQSGWSISDSLGIKSARLININHYRKSKRCKNEARVLDRH
jgi:hypothetical protein